MTDHVSGLFVALDKDIRDDDVQPLIDAILQMKNVLAVNTKIVGSTELLARYRVREEFKSRIWTALMEDGH